MEIRLQQKINKLSPKKLFLLDGLGAILSCFMLGVVLVKLEHIFGMPKQTLYLLSLLAGLFSLYSITSFIVITKSWQPFLKIIGIINLSYCCLTLGLIIYLNEKITIFGMTYFILEIIIVSGLALIEIKTPGNLSD